VSTIAMLWVSQMLAVYGSQYALILMGGILLTVVLWAPEGFVVSAVKALGVRLRRRAAGAARGKS